MANIFDFVNRNKQTGSNKNNFNDSNSEKNKMNKSEDLHKNLKSTFSEDEINKAYENLNQYKDLNQDQLIKLLYDNILESKKNGTFNYQELKASMEAIYPMLNEHQRKLLSKLLDEIK